MGENEKRFRKDIQIDPRKGYEKIMQKQKVFELVNAHPEILDILPAEKLRIIESFYAEDSKKRRTN